MIGIFDSGVGGICAYNRVRELMPYEDIVYIADRKNAPYGTKSEEEIKKLTEKNIEILRTLGASEVLIACCSASSVYHLLSEEARAIATPIIRPAVLEAVGGRRIAVIATRHTATSGAFSRECARVSDAVVFEFDEQALVTLVEAGNRDGHITPLCRDYLRGVADRVSEASADTLILGCTHFSHLEGEIGRLLPKVKIISPARVGAEEIVRKINSRSAERGKITYI